MNLESDSIRRARWAVLASLIQNETDFNGPAKLYGVFLVLEFVQPEHGFSLADWLAVDSVQFRRFWLLGSTAEFHVRDRGGCALKCHAGSDDHQVSPDGNGQRIRCNDEQIEDTGDHRCKHKYKTCAFYPIPN